MDYDKLLNTTAKRANITTKIRNELENKMTTEDIIGYATLAIKDIEETKLDNLRQDNAL